MKKQDWETILIRFVPTQKQDGLEKKVLLLIEQWERDRKRLVGNAVSSRVPLEYGIKSIDPDGTVTLLVGWLCEESLPVFENFLREKAKNIARVEIGIDGWDFKNQKIYSPEKFIRVPDKIVKFEDGKTINVNSFEISQHPVSFGQWLGK